MSKPDERQDAKEHPRGEALTRCGHLGLRAIAGLPLATPAKAQAAGDAAPAAAAVTTLPTAEWWTTPLLASGIGRDKVPANARSHTDRDLLRPPISAPRSTSAMPASTSARRTVPVSRKSSSEASKPHCAKLPRRILTRDNGYFFEAK